ncbi:MAG: UPF0175 family protein [Cytophagales bacterium]|jgi:hypothetical protein|nr:UPF0175 family protein [Cytophagales bacterium]MCE2895097.1 UPF0175 family protein [Flammeovirgaceae bacterium]NOS57136.1 UPF0175 family protein [Cyclobacteriaceae bacterium]MCA6366119.1 UPF0175 family protein [Cytophagales bacterium]MCA6373074.1 UPF0175 family protein [Cytophagales bacterium]
MKRITLDLPDSLGLTEFDVKMTLACQLYHQAKLSSGQAAGLVGISKRAFLETMGNYGYSVFSESLDDLRKDVVNA